MLNEYNGCDESAGHLPGEAWLTETNAEIEADRLRTASTLGGSLVLAFDTIPRNNSSLAPRYTYQMYHLLSSGYNPSTTPLNACIFSSLGLTADNSSNDSKNSICARRRRSVGFAEGLMSGLRDARRYACYKEKGVKEEQKSEGGGKGTCQVFVL
jgi:hypothetical protein